MAKKFVKRLNLKEIKDILNGYKDGDLSRMAIALPCCDDDGTDGGNSGLCIVTQFDDDERDSPIFKLYSTKGFKQLKKGFIDKLNYDFEFRNKLIEEKAEDEDYEDLECDW